MTATGFEPSVDLTEPVFTTEEYHAQWRELEKQFPPPSWDDVKLEWMWLHGGMADGTFNVEPYVGKAIAVYQQRVVGVDIDPLRLRVAKARELGIHPERMIVTTFYPS